jgi:hypothetical protein
LNDDCLLEVAWGQADGGPSCSRCYSFDELGSATNDALAANRAGSNVYVGVTLKSPDAPRARRTSNNHASVANYVVLDFDRDLVAGAKRLGAIARPDFMVITGTQPEARGQCWVRVREEVDLEYWDQITRRLARHCGADTSATGLSRLMRLGGTVSYPSQAKRERGYIAQVTQLHEFFSWLYDLSTLGQLLPSPPREAQRLRPRPVDALPINLTNARLVMSLLDALPPSFAEEYRRWLTVGFALHDFDRGPVGLALWKSFSRRCRRKADRTDLDAYWTRFARGTSSAKITLGSIVYHAKQAGWCAATPWDRATRLS